MRPVARRAVGAAVVLVAAMSGCTSTGVTPEPTAPSTIDDAATPAPSAVVADLSLETTTLRTNGSTGAPSADIDVTVTNNGTTAPAITLTFSDVPMGIAPIGDAWDSCDESSTGGFRTITCPLDPVPAGSSATYTYQFQVTFEEVYTQVESLRNVGQISVTPQDAQESNPADNTGKLEICTNGCTYPPGTYD